MGKGRHRGGHRDEDRDYERSQTSWVPVPATNSNDGAPEGGNGTKGKGKGKDGKDGRAKGKKGKDNKGKGKGGKGKGKSKNRDDNGDDEAYESDDGEFVSKSQSGTATGRGFNNSSAEGPREKLWSWATEVLGREPTSEELSLRVEEVPRKGKGGRPYYRCTVNVHLPSNAESGAPAPHTSGPFVSQLVPKQTDAVASAVRAALGAHGVELPEPADARSKAKTGKANQPQQTTRRVDPAKAKEVIINWLVKKHRMQNARKAE